MRRGITSKLGINSWKETQDYPEGTDVDDLTPVTAYKVSIYISSDDPGGNAIGGVIASSGLEVGGGQVWEKLQLNNNWITTGTEDRSIKIFGQTDDSLVCKLKGWDIER